MNRMLKVSTAAAVAMLIWPAQAFAYTNQVTPFGLHVTVSAVGLVLAAILLVQALRLRKVALGGAIADKLYFVVLAIIALAISALAKWSGNFVEGITFEQTELISELLVILAMGLFAAYFYSVRAAMQAYMKPSPGAADSSSSSE